MVLIAILLAALARCARADYNETLSETDPRLIYTPPFDPTTTCSDGSVCWALVQDPAREGGAYMQTSQSGTVVTLSNIRPCVAQGAFS
jgi:hypothetical protein